MSEDILEELEEEILYASRKAWDSAQSGLNANFLGRVQDEIERLRAENEKLRAALKPFADMVDYCTGTKDGDWMDAVFKLGEVRAAAAALKETGSE